jgi:hypothetical protein
MRGAHRRADPVCPLVAGTVRGRCGGEVSVSRRGQDSTGSGGGVVRRGRQQMARSAEEERGGRGAKLVEALRLRWTGRQRRGRPTQMEVGEGKK